MIQRLSAQSLRLAIRTTEVVTTGIFIQRFELSLESAQHDALHKVPLGEEEDDDDRQRRRG